MFTIEFRSSVSEAISSSTSGTTGVVGTGTSRTGGAMTGGVGTGIGVKGTEGTVVGSGRGPSVVVATVVLAALRISETIDSNGDMVGSRAGACMSTTGDSCTTSGGVLNSSYCAMTVAQKVIPKPAITVTMRSNMGMLVCYAIVVLKEMRRKNASDMVFSPYCGISLMVELQFSKLLAGVRFSYPAHPSASSRD